MRNSASSCTTLVDVLSLRATATPDRIAYTVLRDGETPAGSLTFEMLLDRGRRVASALLDISTSKETRAVLVAPTSVEWLLGFFGCIISGITVVPLAQVRPENVSTLVRVVQDSGAKIVLAEARAAGLLASHPQLKGVKVVALDEALWTGESAVTFPAVTPETVAVLQYTSGSTGNPRGVLVTHANILANERMIEAAFGHDADSVVVGWLPVFHDMGLIGNVLQPLYVGAHAVLMSPLAFLEKPVRWLRAITQYRAHTSGGPDFAYALCSRRVSAADIAELDLSSWKVAFNGSEPVRAGSLTAFAKVFAGCGFQRAAYLPCYGLAEATLFVTGKEPSAEPAIIEFDSDTLESSGRLTRSAPSMPRRQSLVGCGRPQAGMTVVIADKEGNALPEGTVGEIQIAGPNVTQGYWAGVGANRFRDGTGSLVGKRLFLTRDLGAFFDGELYVLGRMDDLVIVRGRNFHPHDLEQAAAQSAQLPPGGAVAFGVNVDGETGLVIVQELRAPIDELQASKLVAAIRQGIVETHGVAVHDVRLVPRGSIPRTTSGKLRRTACKAKYENRGFDEATPVARAVEALAIDANWLREAVAAVLKVSVADVATGRSLPALGVDSLGAATVVARAHDELRIQIGVELLLEAATLEDAAARMAAAPKVDLSASQPVDVVPPAINESRALSHRQRAMWFFQQYAPQSTAYSISCAARLVRDVSPAALAAALQVVVARHPSLASTFHFEDGAPRQQLGRSEAAFRHVEAESFSENELESAILQEARQPFDLEHGSCLRVTLWSNRRHGARMLLSAHHILVDFWSLAVVLEELDSALAGRSTAQPEPRTLAAELSFASFEEGAVATAEASGVDSAILARLRDVQPLLLPLKPPPSERSPHSMGLERFSVGPSTLEGLKALASESSTTLYTVLATAYAVLLYRYCGEVEQFAFGSPTWGRHHPDQQRAVGCFVNTMLVRADVSGDLPFPELVKRMQGAVLEGLSQAQYPYPLAVRKWRSEMGSGRLSPIDALFSFQKAPVLHDRGLTPFALGLPGRLELEHLSLESTGFVHEEFDFALDLAVAEVGDGISGYLAFNANLVHGDVGRQMARHYANLLEQAASDRAWRAASGEILSAKDRSDERSAWNAPSDDIPLDTLLLSELFEAQVAEAPDHVAIVGTRGESTYADLLRSARRIAGVACASAPGAVALLLGAEPHFLEGMLAALVSHTTFVPLDPADPTKRLAGMADDADVGCILTVSRHLNAALDVARESRGTKRVVLLDADTTTACPGVDIVGASAIERSEPKSGGLRSPDDVVYVVYTSGTTGRPKGVPITHRNLAHLMYWLRREFSLGVKTRTLQALSPCFDFGIEEIFSTLLFGGTLVSLGSETRRDPDAFVSLVEQHRITMLYITPAMAQTVVGRGRRMDSLQVILLGGEALDRSLTERLLSLVAPGCAVFNGYGPSEAAINSTMFALTSDWPERALGARSVPIGRRSGHSRLYILNAQGAHVPCGVAGELYIGGPGVASGYLRRDELTATRFLPDPFAENGTMYRSGDLVRRLPSGEIEFITRLDRQVKVRGFRVEPSEVESVLKGQEGVLDACVILERGANDEGSLSAFVVLSAGDDALAATRKATERAVPHYMMPAKWLVLPQIPRTRNGKVDVRQLEQLARTASATVIASAIPQSPLEEHILRAWRHALQSEVPSRDANFFELGAHSVMVVAVQRDLEERLGRSVSVASLFEHPTVARLAGFLTNVDAAEVSPNVPFPERRATLHRLRARLNKKVSL